ncbi:MAG: PD-(D/E)XK nuclease-like domain-containing protein [Burkholderiales bacterium]
MDPDARADAGCFTRREPLSDYLDRVDFVSSSVLRRFARTGIPPSADFKPPPVPKEAALGDALHALMLEPERFDDEYFEAGSGTPPPPDLHPLGLMARTCLSASTCNALQAMRRAILVHGRVPLADWFDKGDKELSIYWTDDAGARWKARPDLMTADIVVELKTATDIRPGPFAKSRRRFGYDLQAAHYVEGVERLKGRRPRFVYVAVESVRPHSVRVYELPPEELARSRDELTQLKVKFAEARREGVIRDLPAMSPAESAIGDARPGDRDLSTRRSAS